MNWDENLDTLAEHKRELSELVLKFASTLDINVGAIQLTSIDAFIDSAGNVVDYLYGFRVSNELRFNQRFQVSRNNKNLIYFGIG